MRKPIVVWNITRTCNLKCVHCYADASARKFKGELDWEQCCAVIDDLADYKVNALLFQEGSRWCILVLWNCWNVPPGKG